MTSVPGQHFRLIRNRRAAAWPRRSFALLGLMLAGCTAAATVSPGPPVSAEAPLGDTAQEPQRSGNLRQSQISVRLQAGPVLVEVTPLVPWVLEAVAPDTQRRLSRIIEAERPALERTTGQSGLTLILVSFSVGPGPEAFQPDDVHMIARGLRERPLAIQPLTPGWGSRRLAQQSTATAVYAFGSGLDLSREMIVEYGGFSDASWAQKVPIIEAERSRKSNIFNPLDRTS
ncbi:MAG: hypothetical protein ACR2QM_07650 [Longimicrobiales bacterium]